MQKKTFKSKIEAPQPHGWGLYRFFGGNPPKLNPPSHKASEGYPLSYIHGFTAVVFERRRIKSKYRSFIDYDFQSQDNREDMLGQLEKEFGRSKDEVRKLIESV